MEAQLIKSARDAMGLTQGEFAQRLGVNLHTVWRWENGRVKPDERTLIAVRSLAAVPNVEPAQ